MKIWRKNEKINFHDFNFTKTWTVFPENHNKAYRTSRFIVILLRDWYLSQNSQNFCSSKFSTCMVSRWMLLLRVHSIQLVLWLKRTFVCKEYICDQLCEKGSYSFSKFSTLEGQRKSQGLGAATWRAPGSGESYLLGLLCYHLHITPHNSGMLGL